MTTARLLVALTLAAAGMLTIPSAVMVSRESWKELLSRESLSTRSQWPGGVDGWSVPASWRRAIVAAVGVTATSLLLGLFPWWCAIMVGGCAGALTMRLPHRVTQADRADDRRRLTVHADLLAACLDAGMSVGAALLAVPSEELAASPRSAGRADDPVRVLDGVAALLMLGVDPDTAWRSAQDHSDLAALAASARRSALGGATLAAAVREHAEHLRAATADAAERSAGRAGVAMTAPLGLCFLPAFLCLGLAPVVVGLLSTLNLF